MYWRLKSKEKKAKERRKRRRKRKGSGKGNKKGVKESGKGSLSVLCLPYRPRLAVDPLVLRSKLKAGDEFTLTHLSVVQVVLWVCENGPLHFHFTV